MKKLSILTTVFSMTFLAVSSVFAAEPKLVSVSATGTSSANSSTNVVDVSASGRYVVFESSAGNLGPATNSHQQIFRKNLLTGQVDLVSVSNAGVPGDKYSYGGSISADGQRVVFSTFASNLGGSNAPQVVMRDMSTGSMTVVSRNSAGVNGNISSSNARISANGRYVSFSTNSNNLVDGDTNNKSDIFVKDLQTGVIERVSVSDNWSQGLEDSFRPDISADGRFVAFSSFSDNLVNGDSNDTYDVFLRDRSLNKTYLVSQSSEGVIGNNTSFFPSISDDGRYIVFYSFSSNFGPSSFSYDVYLRDMVEGTTTLVSKDVNGGPADSLSFRASISGDGRFISYMTRATNIVTPDATPGYDIIVYDRITDKNTRESVKTNGEQIVAAFSFITRLNYDGSVLVFATNAVGLDARDSDNLLDIYARYRDLNTAPVANAGTYAAVECTGLTTPVRLNAAGSSDADGDALSYAWTVPTGTASGVNPIADFYRGDNQSVSLTVKDGKGGQSTATSSVTVRDTQAPSVTLDGSIYLEAQTRTGTASTIAYSASDACDKSLAVNTVESANVTTPGFYPFVIGPAPTESSITVTAIDDNGNSASKTATIIVDDTTAPVFTTMPADVVAEATAVATPRSDLGLIAPTASDIFSVNISNNAPAAFALGAHSIAWTATDENGNSANASSQVIVQDTKAPVFPASIADVSKEATGPETAITLATPGVDDLFLSSLDYSPKGPYAVGEHAVTWSATDTSGNNATSMQLVNITDTTAPALTIPANYIMEANGNPSHVGSLGVAPAAVDLVDGDVTASILVTEPVSGYQLGENTVEYSVADSRDNGVTKTQTIKVADTTKPVFNSVMSVVTKEAEAPTTVVTLTTPDVADHYLDTVSHDAPAGFAFNVGETLVSWTAVDTSGNTEIATQTVNVVDTTAPALTIPAGFSLEANGNPSLVASLGAAPTAQDLVDLDVSANVVITQPANGYQLGDNNVVYSVSDSRSNAVSKTQLINVVDTTKPVFKTALTNVTKEAEGAATVVSLATPEIFDHYLANVSHNAAADFTFSVGSKLVTWTAVDTSGNSNTAIQTVNIVDTTAPTLNVPAAITVEANGNPSNGYAIGTAVATDIVDGNISVNIVVSKPVAYVLGANVVNYSITDNAGNTATATQTVTVVDTTSPALNTSDAPALIEVVASSESTTVNIGNVSATDHYLESVSRDYTSNQFPVGLTTVTWTATDTSGNASTYTQTVRVSYQFNGFKAPVVNGGIYKVGRTIPVKVSLSYLDGSPVVVAQPTLQVYKTSNNEVLGTALEITSTNAADSGSNMRNLGGGSYMYNLDTSLLGKGTYEAAVRPHVGNKAQGINIALK